MTATEAAPDSSRSPVCASPPKMLRWLAALDSVAITRTVSPATTIAANVRARLTIGLSRLLRGTAQVTLTAFWAASPSPCTPYSAVSAPTTTADALPCRPWGAPSWVPTIGNWLSAELSS